MEAFRTRYKSVETVHIPPKELDVGVGVLKDIGTRLNDLPAIPSGFLDVENTTLASTTPSKLTDHSSNLEVGTRSTSCMTDESTRVSDPKILVRIKPRIFSFHQVYVAPSVQMPEELHSVWLQQIKEPLRIVLRHEIDTGSCVQEFMMAGKKENQLKPTVVVSCGDAKVRKQVERVFKSLDWLRALMKIKKIAFVAVIDSTRLSSAEDVPPSFHCDQHISFVLEKLDDENQFCGRRLRLTESNYCTIGGVLLVDKVPHAFTAGHCFASRIPRLQTTLDDQPSVRTPTSNTSEESSDDEPFWFDEDDATNSDSSLDNPTSADSGNPDKASTEHRSTSSSHDLYQASDQAIAVPSWSTNSCSRRVTRSALNYHDWAVIPCGGMTAVKVNEAKLGRLNAVEQISSFASASSHGEVKVVCGQQVFDGYLHPLPSTVQIDLSIFDARLVTMEKKLPLGCSGSWVVANNQLLGHIVATREKVPWAYMIPISATLQDMKIALKTDRIELPTLMDIKNHQNNLAVVSSSSSPQHDSAVSSPVQIHLSRQILANTNPDSDTATPLKNIKGKAREPDNNHGSSSLDLTVDPHQPESSVQPSAQSIDPVQTATENPRGWRGKWKRLRNLIHYKPSSYRRVLQAAHTTQWHERRGVSYHIHQVFNQDHLRLLWDWELVPSRSPISRHSMSTGNIWQDWSVIFWFTVSEYWYSIRALLVLVVFHLGLVVFVIGAPILYPLWMGFHFMFRRCNIRGSHVRRKKRLGKRPEGVPPRSPRYGHLEVSDDQPYKPKHQLWGSDEDLVRELA